MDDLTQCVTCDCFIENDKLKERIKELEIEVEKVAEVRCSIDSDGKFTKHTYCYSCGTGVRNQKYCHCCGRKLNWQALKDKLGVR